MLKHNLKVKEETGIWLLKRLEILFSFLLVFFLPTQLAFYYWGSFSYVFGVRVDYFAVAVYLSDLLIIGLLTVFLLANFQKRLNLVLKFIAKNKQIFVLFLLLVLLNTIFSSLPWVTIYRWTKVVLAIALFYYFKNNGRNLLNLGLTKWMVCSSVLFSVIGIIQFFANSNIGGIFYYLGERPLNTNYPGVALVSFYNNLKLRAYSTFPHPNSMAGYLGLLLLFVYLAKTKTIGLLSNLVSLAGLFVTFSLGGIISFVSAIILKVLKIKISLNKILGAALLIITISLFLYKINGLSTNIKERIDLLYLSLHLVSEKWLLGSGLGTFSLVSPFLQPVHNIFILVLSETGIFGFSLLIYLLFKNFSSASKNVLILLLFVVLTGSVDHYWLTLQQNLFLLPVIFGLINAKIGNS